MASHVVTVTEFKAKCLALLEEVSTTGGTITVTKRGQPLATVGPVAKAPRRRSLRGILKGKVDIPDEVWMADHSDMWDCVREGDKFRI